MIIAGYSPNALSLSPLAVPGVPSPEFRALSIIFKRTIQTIQRRRAALAEQATGRLQAVERHMVEFAVRW